MPFGRMGGAMASAAMKQKKKKTVPRKSRPFMPGVGKAPKRPVKGPRASMPGRGMRNPLSKLGRVKGHGLGKVAKRAGGAIRRAASRRKVGLVSPAMKRKFANRRKRFK